jgi:hypothetical protein
MPVVLIYPLQLGLIGFPEKVKSLRLLLLVSIVTSKNILALYCCGRMWCINVSMYLRISIGRKLPLHRWLTGQKHYAADLSERSYRVSYMASSTLPTWCCIDSGNATTIFSLRRSATKCFRHTCLANPLPKRKVLWCLNSFKRNYKSSPTTRPTLQRRTSVKLFI